MSLKRTIDVVGELFGLNIVSPIITVTALTLRTTMGGPILFRRGTGKLDGRFSAKSTFRTMTNVHGALDQPFPSEQWPTSDGHMSHVTNLDPLPKPWNVTVDHMRLVGLRLLLIGYLKRYSAERARSLNVKAGVTSRAQANDPTSLRKMKSSILKYGMRPSGGRGLSCAFCS